MDKDLEWSVTMEVDEDGPRQPTVPGQNLDDLSIEALREYVQALTAEVRRVEFAIATKQQARSSAETLFKP